MKKCHVLFEWHNLCIFKLNLICQSTYGVSEPIRIESKPPEKDTRLEDIVADLPSTVMSRPGTPDVWNFDEKVSIYINYKFSIALLKKR